MAIVTFSDFNDINSIPTDDLGTQIVIDELCNYTEVDVLRTLLGESEYNLYIETPSNYTELIEGKEQKFELYGYNFKWGGVKEMIKLKVLFQHLEENYSQTGNFGEVRPNINNGTIVVNPAKLQRVYNDYVYQFNLAKNYIIYMVNSGSTLYSTTPLIYLERMNSFGI